MLNGDGIACIDLDHCLADGLVATWAQRILDKLPDTFIEVSPSGDGLHVWGLADFAGGRKLRVDGGQVEVYGDKRYIAMGRPLGGTPRRLADISEAIASLL